MPSHGLGGAGRGLGWNGPDPVQKREADSARAFLVLVSLLTPPRPEGTAGYKKPSKLEGPLGSGPHGSDPGSSLPVSDKGTSATEARCPGSATTCPGRVPSPKGPATSLSLHLRTALTRPRFHQGRGRGGGQWPLSSSMGLGNMHPALLPPCSHLVPQVLAPAPTRLLLQVTCPDGPTPP